MISKLKVKSIYNVHKTGITLVEKSNKVFAKKGTKQIGALTYVEREAWSL